MTPSTDSNLANCPTIRADRIMMGASVRRGAMATLRPSRNPKRMVWLTTTVVVGPGVKPPAKPKTQPWAKIVASISMVSIVIASAGMINNGRQDRHRPNATTAQGADR
jgi:hypothetical protein